MTRQIYSSTLRVLIGVRVRQRYGWRRGQGGGQPKLTPADVRTIRLAGEWDWPPCVVAKLYNLSRGYCSKVMHGETHIYSIRDKS